MNYIATKGDFVTVEKLWKQSEETLTLGKTYVVKRAFLDKENRNHYQNGFTIIDDNGKERKFKHGNNRFSLCKELPEVKMTLKTWTEKSLSHLSISDLLMMKNEFHRIFDLHIKRNTQVAKDIATQCVSRNQKICTELQLRYQNLFEGENPYEEVFDCD